jgi:hypothetical protein
MQTDGAAESQRWMTDDGWSVSANRPGDVVSLESVGLGAGVGVRLFTLATLVGDLELGWTVLELGDGRVAVAERSVWLEMGFTGVAERRTWICPAGHAPRHAEPAELTSLRAIAAFLWRGAAPALHESVYVADPGPASEWRSLPSERAHPLLRALSPAALAAWGEQPDLCEHPTPPSRGYRVLGAAVGPEGEQRILLADAEVAGRRVPLVLEASGLEDARLDGTESVDVRGWILDPRAIDGPNAVLGAEPGFRLRDLRLGLAPGYQRAFLEWRRCRRAADGQHFVAEEADSSDRHWPGPAARAEPCRVDGSGEEAHRFVYTAPGEPDEGWFAADVHGWPALDGQPLRLGAPARLWDDTPLTAALDTWRRRHGAAGGWGLAWYLAAELVERFTASRGLLPLVLVHEGIGYYGIGFQLANCGVHQGLGLARAQLGRLSRAGNVERWLAPQGGFEHATPALWSGDLPPVERGAIATLGIDSLPLADHRRCAHFRGAPAFAVVFRTLALLALRHDAAVAILNDPETMPFDPAGDPGFDRLGRLGYFRVSAGERSVVVAGDGRVLGCDLDLWASHQTGCRPAELVSLVERALGLGA